MKKKDIRMQVILSNQFYWKFKTNYGKQGRNIFVIYCFLFEIKIDNRLTDTTKNE